MLARRATFCESRFPGSSLPNARWSRHWSWWRGTWLSVRRLQASRRSASAGPQRERKLLAVTFGGTQSRRGGVRAPRVETRAFGDGRSASLPGIRGVAFGEASRTLGLGLLRRHRDVSVQRRPVFDGETGNLDFAVQPARAAKGETAPCRDVAVDLTPHVDVRAFDRGLDRGRRL